jgi:hypothetical protein
MTTKLLLLEVAVVQSNSAPVLQKTELGLPHEKHPTPDRFRPQVPKQ